MRLWRLSSARRARDFDGGFGLHNNGRWNTKGRPVTYCATVPSLSALEKRAHVTDPGLLPDQAGVVMRRRWDTIIWWELRRIPFNVLLFVVGILSLGSILLIGSYFVTPGEDVIEPLAMIFGAIVYGVFANLAYTLGWATEL